jgi:superfamily II DNA or RNA helicase
MPLRSSSPAISYLKFPFSLKNDQLEAVHAWIAHGFRGTVVYSSGTGKTEIAFECARRAAAARKASTTFASTTTTTTDKRCSSTSSPSPDCYISSSYSSSCCFNILYLVPRIVLIEQNFSRLLAYCIPEESIGKYYGEIKEIREITISTYQSVINNHDLVRKADMVIFDEVHLIRDTAKTFRKIFDLVVEDNSKSILGLTATINERDYRYNTIMTVMPPVKKYPIKDAVEHRRLARPIIIPMQVNLTDEEQKVYDIYSAKIKNISNRFKKYDAKSMSLLLSKGGFVSGLAKAWFLNVRKRKLLLSYTENKLSKAVSLIKKHPYERIMVFSETLESINKLRNRLESEGIKAKIIDSKINSKIRQEILYEWGKDFFPLLSVHTLEIGYNVPQVRIEIILATTSNMNQVIQRIGRVIRKYEGKELALIYVIYVSETKDNNILNLIMKAVDIKQEYKGQEKSEMNKRLQSAYNIIESSLHEPVIVEEIHNQKKFFRVRSSNEKSKFYDVDAENKICSCPDFKFRLGKCKHILATELVSSPLDTSTITTTTTAAA